MFELLALAPEDGWACVRSGDQIQLLRPPYTATSCSTISEASVEIAVSRHGFVVPSEDERIFPDLAAVVGFLNAEVGRVLAAHGAPPSQDAAEGLLEFAPVATLREFLQRTRDELIPNARWDHAEKLLLRMLSLPTVYDDRELRAETVALLKRVSEGRSRQAEGRRVLAAEDLPQTFPNAVKHYGMVWIIQTSRTICLQRTVFVFR